MADIIISPRNIKHIPIQLRDTYARVQLEPIFNLEGSKEPTVNADILGHLTESKHFLASNNMFGYIYRTAETINSNDMITIVIQGLRNLYWDNRLLLPQDDRLRLEQSMGTSLPKFYNVYEYKSLAPLRKSADMVEYEVLGNITPYDVVHIPVLTFVEAINEKKIIEFNLEYIGVNIALTYKLYDLWDQGYERIIDHINII